MSDRSKSYIMYASESFLSLRLNRATNLDSIILRQLKVYAGKHFAMNIFLVAQIATDF